VFISVQGPTDADGGHAWMIDANNGQILATADLEYVWAGDVNAPWVPVAGANATETAPVGEGAPQPFPWGVFSEQP